MKPHIENENTFKQALENGISLYTGAGFSVLASDSEGKDLPVGNALKDELIENFELSNLVSLELSKLSTILESTRSLEFEKYLRSRFHVEKFSNLYRVLRRINLRSIFSVNVDDLPIEIFKFPSFRYLHDVTTQGPPRDQNAIKFIPLHGCVANPQQRLNFTKVDLASSNAHDSDRWNYLIQELQSDPILFWGTELDDPGVLYALDHRSIRGRPHRQKWMQIRESNPAVEAYYRSLGFSIVISDTEALLEYLNTQTPSPDPATKVMRKREQIELFPECSMPSPISVPVRSINQFFLGNEPVWYDIFSQRIPKTSHFDAVLDAINSGVSVVVFGMPFSGKSTLLKQIAFEAVFKGYKLIFNSLTSEQADSILGRLVGESALVFLDNFCDNLDGFLRLLDSENVQIVGFDRDSSFEIISHFIERDKVKLINVSEVSVLDSQRIFNQIPQAIRQDELTLPELSDRSGASLFELIELNVTEPTLRERVPALHRQLKSQSEELHSLLLMLSYVTECGTVASLDMISTYLGIPFDYEILFLKISKLGSLVGDFSENALSELSIHEDQDFFGVRSSVFSSALLNEAARQDLHLMIKQFHDRITPYRIVRYDIFQKKAYSAKLIRKAFADVEEGKQFYEEIYQKRPNVYVLQQGAIFLSGHYRFKEAFGWLDEALSGSKGRQVHSIRNTYANILFRANFSQGEDVRASLDESMEILAKLYYLDDRKNYHVETFAKQAIDYFNKYQDERAIAYLRTAESWLLRESERSEWNNYLRRRLKKVQEIIKREAN